MSVTQKRPADSRSASGGYDVILERARRLADELARRWAIGERPRAEEFLAGDAEVAARADAALEIVYEEICQRPATEAIDEARWFERFPAWRTELQMLLACHHLLDGADEPRYPEVGDTFGEFSLLAELGRGLQGRVYLARQPALADRPVVLKITPLTGQEHLSLARLQHTHVVPLYGAHDDAARGMRALCMPYFGGITLFELLERLRAIAPAKRTGRDLLEALSAAAAEQPLASPVEGPACRYLQQASYVDAICWIGTCLADALHDAHQRNIVHLDLKPSNVLLAADGQPMLLDFHLAQPPIAAGKATLEWLGGTPDYMPPEQKAALEAVRQAGDVPRRVDGRADVYSLTLTLCEALAGKPPEGVCVSRWLRTANPRVGMALSDLLARGLSPDAHHRYADAGSLAEDLRRHLAHRPLRHVANRSLLERWSKWRSRRPYALAFLALFATLAAWGLVGAAGVRQRLDDARSALDEVDGQLAAGSYERADLAAQRARRLVSGVPWSGGLADRLREAERLAAAGQVADRLHELVERFRTADVVFGEANERASPEQVGAAGEVALLGQQAERLWKQRKSILANLSSPIFARIGDRVTADLTVLAILWADSHVRWAPADKAEQAAREALAVLNEAEALPGPHLVLHRAKERLARMLGDERQARDSAAKADRLVPDSPWEHLALGRLLLADGHLREAAAEFSAAVESEPQGLWPNFYAGRAAYELGRFDEAARWLTACVALAPRAAWCYYNRGLAYEALGDAERAKRDFERARELQPAGELAEKLRGD